MWDMGTWDVGDVGWWDVDMEDGDTDLHNMGTRAEGCWEQNMGIQEHRTQSDGVGLDTGTWLWVHGVWDVEHRVYKHRDLRHGVQGDVGLGEVRMWDVGSWDMEHEATGCRTVKLWGLGAMGPWC